MRILILFFVVSSISSFGQAYRSVLAGGSKAARPSVAPVEFQYGLNKTTEQRQSNWEALKTSCEENETINFDGKILEVYNPDLEEIPVVDGQNLTIQNVAIIVYPFVPREGLNWVFELEYGSHLTLVNTTLKCAARQNLFESYNCILKKDNARVIEVLGSTRSDFWTSLEVGQDIFYSWSELVLGKHGTISSVNSVAHTITLNADIDGAVTTNLSGDTVWFGTKFREGVSISDYETFGRHWVYGETSSPYMNFSGIRHGPGPSSGTDCIITLTNSKIENFKNNLDIVSGNFKVVINGNVEINSAEVGMPAFARSQLNGQSITGDTLIFKRNGLISVGSLEFISSRNIYGSGGYIHPTVIVDLEKLVCTDNDAAAFRQYSASIEVVNPEGQVSHIKEYIGSGNGEYDFYSSNCMPVTIDNFIGETALYIGGTLTVNGGDIPTLAATTLLHPPDGVAALWQFNNCTINNGLSFGWPVLSSPFLDIEFNDCDLISHPISGDVNSLIKNTGNETGSIQFNDVRLLNDGSITTYTPGGSTTGTPTQYLLSGFSRYSSVEIDSLVTDYMIGGLLLYDSEYPKDTTKHIQVDNSEINLSKLIDTAPTSLPTFLTDQIRGVHTKIVSGYNYSGYNLPLSFSPKVGSVSRSVTPSVTLIANKAGESTVINNVLEIDFEHDEYLTSGIIRHVAPITWAGTSKVRSTSMFDGTIKLTATGGSITLVAYDAGTNDYGNLLSGAVIPEGESVFLTSNNLHIFALGEAEYTELVSSTFAFLTHHLIKNFSSDSDYSFVDPYTGIYSGNNGANVTYDYFVNWRNTGAWSITE